MKRTFRQSLSVMVVVAIVSQPAWSFVDDSKINVVTQYVTTAAGTFVVADHYDAGDTLKTKTTMILDNETGSDKQYKHEVRYQDDNGIIVHSKLNVTWTVPAHTRWVRSWSEEYTVPATDPPTYYCVGLELLHKVGTWQGIDSTCRTYDLDLGGPGGGGS